MLSCIRGKVEPCVPCLFYFWFRPPGKFQGRLWRQRSAAILWFEWIEPHSKSPWHKCETNGTEALRCLLFALTMTATTAIKRREQNTFFLFCLLPRQNRFLSTSLTPRRCTAGCTYGPGLSGYIESLYPKVVREWLLLSGSNSENTMDIWLGLESQKRSNHTWIQDTRTNPLCKIRKFDVSFQNELSLSFLYIYSTPRVDRFLRNVMHSFCHEDNVYVSTTLWVLVN